MDMKLVQPESGGDNGAPTVVSSPLNVRECGAVGDGSTNCTTAIQQAIDRCAAAGGGTVLVPAGKYVTGSLLLRSHITLHLDSGATLLGSMNMADYPVWVSRWEGSARPTHAGLIGGESLVNIAITGRGAIDARGEFWWEKFNQNRLTYSRPCMVRLVDCRDILMSGITCTNSPFWTLNPTACDNVTIHGVTVRNPADSPNTDGINPDSCCNVHISDCHIDVGDDCLTFKSGSEDDGRQNRKACENITVTNCTMLRGHGGVVIGSEMSGGVRNIAISNCVFSGTDRGIRLKSRRGRGGVVEDIRVDNVVMDSVLCPIVLYLFYGCGAWGHEKVTDRSPHPVDAGTPTFRRLRFSNISAQNVKYAAVFALGLPEMPIEDVTLEGISINLDANNVVGGSPAMAPGIGDMCRAGVVLENARDVRLCRVGIHDQLGPAVTIRNSSDVAVSDLSARRDGEAPLLLMDGQEFELSEANESSFVGNGWRPVRKTRSWVNRDITLPAADTSDGAPANSARR
ncbi:MAG TPA: glycoside hydrolase family 28 protein [Tepidisphaeraceae bacterium]|nr:glycoside hydrolase family 28 protein [Tepidisphaeraceae bacterium]